MTLDIIHPSIFLTTYPVQGYAGKVLELVPAYESKWDLFFFLTSRIDLTLKLEWFQIKINPPPNNVDLPVIFDCLDFKASFSNGEYGW